MRSTLIVTTALAVTLAVAGCANAASKSLTVAEKLHVEKVATYDGCYEDFVGALDLSATEARSIALPEIREECGADPHTPADTWDHWKPVKFKG